MLFNSIHFLFFLPIVVGLYYLLPKKLRWILIFVSSCYFYMAFIPKYIFILFFIIIIDYLSAIAIEKNEGKLKLTYLIASLSANILLLCFFKYFNFLNDNLAPLFSLFGKDFHPINLQIILPIGLSFHTFQSMSYTIEVYRGKQKAEKHIGYFANYVLFFPQMVAGPIERYDRLGEELKKEQNLIGYSTIALGSAKILGITIMDNFKTPYFSKSVTEFWSRWHISLSSWFKDYLYIPLGGNRVAIPRWSLNILIVFMLSGLWHGANWTFVVWGGLHGLVLLIERYFSKIFMFEIKKEWRLLNVFLILKTFIVTSFIWIFFRAENFNKAKEIISVIFINNNIKFNVISLKIPLIAIIGLIIFDFFHYNSRFDKKLNTFKTPYRWAIYSFLFFCLFALSGTEKFSFIYFQF